MSRQIFEKYSNTKFRENLSARGPSCSTRTCRRTDRMQINVTFRNFANAPAKQKVIQLVFWAGDIGTYSELYTVHNVQ